MAEILYTVFFKGEIAKGHNSDDVQQKLISNLPAEGHQISQAFKGQPLTMKNLSRDRALKLVEAFESVGALCQIEVQRQGATQTPPQRPAQRPPQRPAQQFQTERPREAPSGRAPLHDPDETITCAKCGLIQPRGTECARCGVLFDKIETVTQLANDPDLIAPEIAESYRSLLRNTEVCLTPAIPHDIATKVLAPYLDPDAKWQDDEEFVINSDEELVAMLDATAAPKSSRLNFLLTNLKFMMYRWVDDGPLCAGFDLYSIKRMILVGEGKSTLMIDETTIELPIVPEENQRTREIFIKMASEIVRALKQADRAARLKAKRAWHADPQGGRPEPSPPSFGNRPRKGKVTLQSLDLRDIQKPSANEINRLAGNPTDSDTENDGNLLSSVKGFFKKK